MKLPDPPAGWGDDKITDFLDNARRNAFATYGNLRPEYARLAAIDSVFRKLIDSLLNTKDWFAAFFLLRAHSSFLGAAHLAMAGQAAEAYALLRLTLENALYGLYLAEFPASRETWLRRHDSAEANQKVRGEFTVRRLLDTLARRDAQEAKVEKELYDRCINYGAHPNERALTQSLRTTRGEDRVEVQVIYLTAETVMFQACLRTAAQVGVCALSIFRLVYKERFDLTGLTDELDRAKRGL